MMHRYFVGACHDAGFRGSGVIEMVGTHILLRECQLGSEGDHRDGETQKHSSNRFHAAPLKGIECLMVKRGNSSVVCSLLSSLA
jgi:hypothetical protein